MGRRSAQLNSPAWIKILIHDLFVASIIAASALCVGLVLNHFRDNRLPLVYTPRAERIQQAVVKFGGSSVVSKLPGKDAESPLKAATVGYLELPDLREIAEGKVKAILLDARPEVFHRLSHIPGAVSLSRENFERDYAKRHVWLESNKSQYIVVYCSDSECEDSQMVADALVKLAYTHVFVFKGGWNDWTCAHLPEEKAQ